MVLKRSFSMAIVTSSGRLQLRYTGLPPSFLLIFSPNDLHWEDSSSVRVAFITGIENRCQCKNKHIRNTYTLFCLCTNNNGTSCISPELSHPKLSRAIPIYNTNKILVEFGYNRISMVLLCHFVRSG